MIEVSKKKFNRVTNFIIVFSLLLAGIIIPVTEYYSFAYTTQIRIIAAITIMFGGIVIYNLRVKKEKKLEDHLID